MRARWQLQEAKNRFSEVVERALRDGPQVVTRHGHEVVMVVSVDTWKRVARPDTLLVDFLRSSPLAGLELDVERDSDAGREVEL
jgi:prevent-host-death family protein